MRETLERYVVRLLSLPPLLRTLNRALNRFPVILTLHRRANPEQGIGGHDPAVIREQLQFILRNGYRVVAMDAIDAWVNGADLDMTNTVAFTFDDGYRDQAEVVREVFVPLGIPATMFLITDFVDGRLWPWDTRIKWLIHNAPTGHPEIHIPTTGLQDHLESNSAARRKLANRFISHLEFRPPEIVEAAIRDLACALQMHIPESPPPYHTPLSWDDARELEKFGIRFGSHSQSHHVFSGLTNEEAERQIRHARARLENELAAPLLTFGYPIGNRWNFTGRELKLLSEIGYTSAVTMTPGAVAQPEPGQRYAKYVINRYSMPETVEDLVQYVSWIERIKDRARTVAPRTLIRSHFGSPKGMVRRMTSELHYRLGRLKCTEDIDWTKVQRVVFVCKGNVCRSPFAEAVARRLSLPAVSVGLETDQGTRVNPIASRIALEMGVDMTEHASQRLEPSQLQDGDLIVGMEPAHLERLNRCKSPANVQRALLGLQLPGNRVPYLGDPYGLSDAYHRHCFGMIQRAVEDMSAKWLLYQQPPTADTNPPVSRVRERGRG
jgi:protein-tyrosine-phosphatase/peptidoglycan/xylan/chitin deacetylase (PgdA/CDA1 family)